MFLFLVFFQPSSSNYFYESCVFITFKSNGIDLQSLLNNMVGSAFFIHSYPDLSKQYCMCRIVLKYQDVNVFICESSQILYPFIYLILLTLLYKIDIKCIAVIHPVLF